jgi:hypothetical protein
VASSRETGSEVMPLENSTPVPFWNHEGYTKFAACPQPWKFVGEQPGNGNVPAGKCVPAFAPSNGTEW